MLTNYLQSAILSTLLIGLTIPAHAGIYANIHARPESHRVNFEPGQQLDSSAPTFGGQLRSGLEKSGSCRSKVPTVGDRFTFCYFAADSSQFISSYEQDLLGRFSDGSAAADQQLSAHLTVKPDGSFVGSRVFIHGKDVVNEDEASYYQMSFNANYQFNFRGNGLDPNVM